MIEAQTSPQQEGSRRLRSTISVFDAAEEDFLDDELEALCGDVTALLQAERRGTRQLWSLLGAAYALGCKAEKNSKARAKLVAKVLEDPATRSNKRWKAESKTSFELLVSIMLGRDESKKVTRSQWLGALRAASKAEVPPSQSDFVNWLEDLGGVAEARQLANGERTEPHTVEELGQTLIEMNDLDLDTRIELPGVAFDGSASDQMALVVVRWLAGTTNAVPIATITTERLVSGAIKQALKDQGRLNREINQMFAREVRERQKPLRKRWKHHTKAGVFEGTFEDYLDAGAPEEI